MVERIQTHDMMPSDREIIFKISKIHYCKINQTFVRYEILENVGWTDAFY